MRVLDSGRHLNMDSSIQGTCDSRSIRTPLLERFSSLFHSHHNTDDANRNPNVVGNELAHKGAGDAAKGNEYNSPTHLLPKYLRGLRPQSSASALRVRKPNQELYGRRYGRSPGMHAPAPSTHQFRSKIHQTRRRFPETHLQFIHSASHPPCPTQPPPLPHQQERHT